MSKSWDSYYVVFLSGILSLGIPLGLSLISWIFFPRHKGAPEPLFTPKSSHLLKLGRSYQLINVRFFMAANAALVLIALALELIPCVVTLQSDDSKVVLRGLIAVVSLACFSTFGLIYATHRGKVNRGANEILPSPTDFGNDHSIDG